MLGPKIDARLNQLERKLVDLTHKIERIDALKQAAVAEHGFGAILPGLQKLDEMTGALERRVIALEAKRSPGRPPKAKNG